MITFLGDVYLDKPYIIDFSLDNYIFNLEFPIDNQGVPASGKVNLGQGESYILDTFKKLPLAVCLANNHILDYGIDSYQKTIDYLKENNIQYFGAGTEKENFNNPIYIPHSGKKIGLLGYVCETTKANFVSESSNVGCAKIELEKIKQDLQIAKQNSNFVIVQLHWGDEEIKYPKPSDVKIARDLIDSGADLIIGHHAHVIQSHETHNFKNIFYGIGNFLFPDLNVPAFHNGEKFTSNYVKQQSKFNKESVIINLNDKYELQVQFTQFDGRAVRTKTRKLSNKILEEEDYQKFHARWIRKKKIMNFISNPSKFKLSKIKNFFK